MPRSVGLLAAACLLVFGLTATGRAQEVKRVVGFEPEEMKGYGKGLAGPGGPGIECAGGDWSGFDLLLIDALSTAQEAVVEVYALDAGGAVVPTRLFARVHEFVHVDGHLLKAGAEGNDGEWWSALPAWPMFVVDGLEQVRTLGRGCEDRIGDRSLGSRQIKAHQVRSTWII